MKKKIKPKSILKEFKKIPSDKEFLKSLREELVFYIKANPLMEQKARVGWFGFKAKTVPAALIGLVAILSGVGTVAASQNSLPGETLYNIKLLSEKARVAVILDPKAKAALRFALAQKRINEAKEFIEKAKTERLAREQQEAALTDAVTNFNDNLGGVYNWADNLRNQGRFEEAIQINANLKTAAGVYQQILEQGLDGDKTEKTESEMDKNLYAVDKWKNRANEEINNIDQQESLGARSTGLENSAQDKINAAAKKVEVIEKIIEKKKDLDTEVQELSRQKLQDTKKILEDAKQDYDGGDYENAFGKAQDLMKSLSGAKAFLEISPQIDAKSVNAFWNQEKEGENKKGSEIKRKETRDSKSGSRSGLKENNEKEEIKESAPVEQKIQESKNKEPENSIRNEGGDSSERRD